MKPSETSGSKSSGYGDNRDILGAGNTPTLIPHPGATCEDQDDMFHRAYCPDTKGWE